MQIMKLINVIDSIRTDELVISIVDISKQAYLNFAQIKFHSFTCIYVFFTFCYFCIISKGLTNGKARH